MAWTFAYLFPEEIRNRNVHKQLLNLAQFFRCFFQEVTHKKTKDRSKKTREHLIITFLFISALLSDFFWVSLIRASPFFLGRKERIEEGMV